MADVVEYNFSTNPDWISEAVEFTDTGLEFNFKKLSALCRQSTLPTRMCIVLESSTASLRNDVIPEIEETSQSILETPLSVLDTSRSTADASQSIEDNLQSAIAVPQSVEDTSQSPVFTSQSPVFTSQASEPIPTDTIPSQSIVSTPQSSEIDSAAASTHVDTLPQKVNTNCSDKKGKGVSPINSGSPSFLTVPVEQKRRKPVRRSESVIAREIRRQKEREDEVKQERQKALHQSMRRKLHADPKLGGSSSEPSAKDTVTENKTKQIGTRAINYDHLDNISSRPNGEAVIAPPSLQTVSGTETKLPPIVQNAAQAEEVKLGGCPNKPPSRRQILQNRLNRAPVVQRNPSLEQIEQDISALRLQEKDLRRLGVTV